MSNIELSAKLDRWIDDNTADSDFVAHPDFVYDKLLELETEIKKLREENAKLKKQSQWIRVDDELPEFNTVVLVKVYRERGITWPESDYSCAAKLSQVTRHCGENSPIDSRWYVFPSGGTEITKDVTHWMPLPTQPEGERYG